MQDSLSTRRAPRRLFSRLLYLGGFLVIMTGSTFFHYVKETTPSIRPFGELLFFLGIILTSFGGLVSAGNMLRFATAEGTARWGWGLMSFCLLVIIGSVLMIGLNFRSVFYENVPAGHFLASTSPDSSSIELHFKTGWVYRSPFRKAYIIPQEGWNVRFCPEMQDERGVKGVLLLSFNCTVDPTNGEGFATGFAESFKQLNAGQRIPNVLLGPITTAYNSAIKTGVGNRPFGNIEDLRQAIAESLAKYFEEVGLKVTDVKLTPLPALQQPAAPQIGRPFV